MKKKRKHGKRGYSVSMPREDEKNFFKKSYPSASSIEKAGHEIKMNEPAIVAKTRKKKGNAAARRQKVAIMLSKARRGDY